MQILATLKVADGYVSEREAIQVAKYKADFADEDPEVEFDSEKALWKVTLSGKNTSGDDTFIIDVRGNIVEIIEQGGIVNESKKNRFANIVCFSSWRRYYSNPSCNFRSMFH